MYKARKMLPAAVASLLLSGCYGHSFPTSRGFIHPDGVPERSELFADANGTFYPPDWPDRFKPSKPWKADSLLNQGALDNSPQFNTWLAEAQTHMLAEVRQFGVGKKRIFILVHGYNNTVSEAAPAFKAVEQKLKLEPGDGVLRLYWDGLSGKLLGGGAIWFPATGNSQLVGVNALRPILNQFSDADVYLISHSRGASVILSALANPVYDPKFVDQTLRVAETWGGDKKLLWPEQNLAENRNRLHVMMLAPAVDRIDFCDQSQQPRRGDPFECGKYRAFSSQVVSLRYTVNPGDQVLNKFVGASGGFNPTRLGTKAEVGNWLKVNHYGLMRGYLMKPAKAHGFLTYVESPQFDEMLADEHLGKGSPAQP